MTIYVWEIGARDWFYYKGKKINRIISRWIGHVALKKVQRDVMRKRKGKRNLVRTSCRNKT
jgi:hypothetical protein